MQNFIDGKWKYSGGRLHVAQIGNPYGVCWHYGHAHLQEFMHRCLPIVADPERGDKQGLRLALRFYRTNFRDDFVELQYLKSWMAMEILFSCYLDSMSIMRSGRFGRVSEAIKTLLGNCQEKGFIEQYERSLMQEKLGELNRRSARRQSFQFFEDIFSDFPAQTVTEEDIKVFVKIRNDIMHRGVMSREGADDYGEVLLTQHMRLMSLLKRVFLAMMGQDANLMAFSWTEWLEGT